MRITRDDCGNSIVFRLEGSLSVEDISTFQEVMNSCLPDKKHVVLEMSEISFIDSASLGIIVLFYSKMLQQDTHLLVCNVKPDIYQMLNLTGVSKKIKIFKNREEALDFLGKPGQS